MTPHEHYLRAEKLLAEGVGVVKRIGTVAQERSGCTYGYEQYGRHTARMDELGKKAMGIWAQAQVHATLATATEAAP